MTGLHGICLNLASFCRGTSRLCRDAYVSASLSLIVSQPLDTVLVQRALLLVLQRVVAARFLKKTHWLAIFIGAVPAALLILICRLSSNHTALCCSGPGPLWRFQLKMFGFGNC